MGAATEPGFGFVEGDTVDLDELEQLRESLEMMQRTRQLEHEKKIELERSLSNYKQQTRSLSTMHSAEKQQVAVLRTEVEQLRGLLQGLGRQAPEPSQQAAMAQAAAEARAQAAVGQLDVMEEAMRIARAENQRQSDEITLLHEQHARSSKLLLEAEGQQEELQRTLRDRDSAVRAHEARSTAMSEKYETQHQRAERRASQLVEAQKQLGLQRGELRAALASHADERTKLELHVREANTSVELRGRLATELSAAREQLFAQVSSPTSLYAEILCVE